ncbi:class I SAM-dependent methyltransferase [Virgibacillus sp. AGTR]|uniref:Class I SAM-dependent methyltransferase n=1 Tax=Virgibacillus salarius TaxID=447199 RepID=A0A941DVI1_9BACI|nr:MULTISPECIES: class I SAM-dependent methyltransferase [Virgibacillus]NAZ08904.1 methyltransferase domain-containing protein [Agaribacter marinus]MBR7796196.1 class I SAM-dependent methyltransferase [Virgibacillus salarius]MCC2249709.1 class I SAM-dependent methyltransferase [Virgibacillus sp. AGTR]MDY7042700.1 class I SAM-dependent methyltransferase [Virgibacillus sp. M23]QRZ17154.1 class I SAM-dependent methyltransferase [Virgibacillus sp. AGTR]
MFSYYGKLSTELYDFTKPVGHSVQGDIEYYFERLKGTKGRILEAASGSGRFLIPLLEKGYHADGIDYSSEMLASCRKRCDKRGLKPNLYEANICDFSLPLKYEVIVIPTGSFCLIENIKDAKNALKCFYNHLIPNGRLILDLLIPSDWNTGEIFTSTFSLSSNEGIILENKSIEIDWVEQYTLSHLRYEKWKKGELQDTELQKFVIRWYGVEEFKLLLEKIGFSQVTCSAEYNYQKPPSKQTKLITFEAVKK